MKITKQELKQLIKEEVDFLLKELEVPRQMNLSQPSDEITLPDVPVEVETDDAGVWENLPGWAKNAIMIGGGGALQYGISKLTEPDPELSHADFLKAWNRHQNVAATGARERSPVHVGGLKGQELWNWIKSQPKYSGPTHPPGVTGVHTKLVGQRTDDFHKLLQAVDPENFPDWSDN